MLLRKLRAVAVQQMAPPLEALLTLEHERLECSEAVLECWADLVQKVVSAIAICTDIM